MTAGQFSFPAPDLDQKKPSWKGRLQVLAFHDPAGVGGQSEFIKKSISLASRAGLVCRSSAKIHNTPRNRPDSPHVTICFSWSRPVLDLLHVHNSPNGLPP